MVLNPIQSSTFLLIMPILALENPYKTYSIIFHSPLCNAKLKPSFAITLCSTSKHENQKHDLYKPLHVPSQPCESLSISFLGNFLCSGIWTYLLCNWGGVTIVRQSSREGWFSKAIRTAVLKGGVIPTKFFKAIYFTRIVTCTCISFIILLQHGLHAIKALAPTSLELVHMFSSFGFLVAFILIIYD